MKNDYSHLLVAGDSYISSLSVALLSQRYESVSYLKGNSFSLDPSYQSRLSGFEFYFLRSLGRNTGISSLRRLDHFVLSCPFTFHLDNKSILLGRSIRENLQELKRKLGTNFEVSNEEINFLHLRMSQYLDEISSKFARQSVKEINLSLKMYKDQRGVFELIYKLAHRLNPSMVRSLCALYENFTPKKIDDLYRVRILIDIISPFFLINSEKIDEDICQFLKEENIEMINDTANGTSIQESRLKGLSLSKSNITYHFEELVGIGAASDNLDLQVRVQEDKMVGIDFIFQAHELLYYPISRFEFYTSQNWLGSSIKCLEIQKFGNKTVVTFRVSSDAISKAEASFIEFLKSELDLFLEKLGVEKLSKTVPYFINHYDTHYIEKYARTMKKAVKVKDRVRYALWNDKAAHLPNTCFLGQYSHAPLGKVSLFQKILQYSVK